MASDRPSAPTGAATKPCAISKFRFEFRDCGAGCGPGSARQKTTVNRTLGRADRLIDGRDTLLAQFRRSSRPRSQTTTESTLAKRRTPPGGGVRDALRGDAPRRRPPSARLASDSQRARHRHRYSALVLNESQSSLFVCVAFHAATKRAWSEQITAVVAHARAHYGGCGGAPAAS